MPLGACQSDPTSLPASDSTPPTVALDIYSLPAQPSGTPANPESVDSSCCAREFEVNLSTELSLAAGANDPEGVSLVTIRFELTRFCSDPTSHLAQSRHASGIVARNQADVSPSPGVQVPTNVSAAGNFSLVGRDPGCLPEAPQADSISAIAWAEAHNFFGGSAETHVVTLFVP